MPTRCQQDIPDPTLGALRNSHDLIQRTHFDLCLQLRERLDRKPHGITNETTYFNQLIGADLVKHAVSLLISRGPHHICQPMKRSLTCLTGIIRLGAQTVDLINQIQALIQELAGTQHLMEILNPAPELVVRDNLYGLFRRGIKTLGTAQPGLRSQRKLNVALQRHQFLHIDKQPCRGRNHQPQHFTRRPNGDVPGNIRFFMRREIRTGNRMRNDVLCQTLRQCMDPVVNHLRHQWSDRLICRPGTEGLYRDLIDNCTNHTDGEIAGTHAIGIQIHSEQTLTRITGDKMGTGTRGLMIINSDHKDLNAPFSHHPQMTRIINQKRIVARYVDTLPMLGD